MNMKRLVVVALLLVPASGAVAVELSPGVEYTGEVTLESAQHGVSFVLPAGWIGVLPPDGEYFVMRSQAFEAYILAGIEQMTIAEARRKMSQPIDVGDGVVLHPRGQVRARGSVLNAEYTIDGSSIPLVGRVRAVVGDHGWGAYFIAASGPPDAARLDVVIEGLSRSLTLRAPRVASPPSPAASRGPWLAELDGRKLSHFFTRSGYTEEDYFWLCPGGRFFRSFNSGGFGGGASGAFKSGNGGVWQVSGSLDGGELLLTYNDGSTARYRLTHEGTKLFLDGKRYFREAASCD